MKKRLIIIAVFLLLVALLWTTGNHITNQDTTDPIPQIKNADIIYTDAITNMAAEENIALNISRTQESILGKHTFVESSTQMLSYTGIGTDNMQAALSETLTIDQYQVAITEYYAAGVGYVTVNDGSFYGEISAEDYQDRFAPPVLLDPAKYNSIVGYDTGNQYKIEFSQPNNAEQWAFESSTAIENAKGVAYVSYDGQLLGSEYILTYQRGQTRIRLSYEVGIEVLQAEITIPEVTDQHQKIEYLDGPRMLERATGYLLQADNVSSTYTENSYCQAFGDRREQEIITHTAEKDGEWSALVKTSIHLTNESKIGAQSDHKKTEWFLNGKYHTISNTDEQIVNNNITAEDMRTYCQNQLIGTVMLPEDISGIRLEENESTIRLLFSSNESFANKVSVNVCRTLYQKPDLLNDISQSHTTNTIQGYLEFDSTTYLPTGSGILYDGTFFVESVPYSVRFQADQVYDIISATAQDEIRSAGNS